MKKILILSMSCNDEFFVNQVNKIKETWGKDIIDGVYSNIDFMSYDGWEKNHSYDKEKLVLHLRCEDDLDNTYKKTYYALNVIQKSFDYDYVFRTNTSTYVNVPLLNEFVQSLDNDEILWTSELYSLVESNTPYPLNLYGRGNGLLLSRKLIDIILKDGISLLYEEHVDDVMIGNVLNSYWIKNGKNYEDYIKSFTHGWFKAVDIPLENNHQLSIYGNTNTDYEFWKDFITIQTKMYYSREIENNNYDEFHQIMSKKTNENFKSSLDKIYKYSENPSVFIGSILGYIDYNEWKKYPKSRLWELECSNKADNDENKDKYYPGKQWY